MRNVMMTEGRCVPVEVVAVHYGSAGQLVGIPDTVPHPQSVVYARGQYFGPCT